ncbi:hypothetical protein CFOL_v3_06004, partial [Cephalotus follicularis]
YSKVSPLDFFNSTKWKDGVNSNTCASIDNAPFFPSFGDSNFNTPPSLFFAFSRRCLATSSSFDIIAEAECLDVKLTSSFWSSSANKPDKSNPVERDMISKAFK